MSSIPEKHETHLSHRVVFLDFETRSAAKLTGKDSVGAWRYSIDETTSVLCLAYAFNQNEPKLWVPGQPQPQELINAFETGWAVRGWNAMSFERAIFENQMKAKLGWVVPDRLSYYDTMLDALALALPAALDKCGAALSVPVTKDKEGKRLINYLCKPISSGKKKGQFRERHEFHKDFAALYSYCKQDVRAERAIHEVLPYTLDNNQRSLALLIMKMNERGIPVNRVEVEAIHRAVEIEKERLNNKFKELTGGLTPSQSTAYKGWLNSKLIPMGIKLDNVQAETLRDLAKEENLPPKVCTALELTQMIKKTSVAKYSKILAMLCPDGTVKNNFIYHKANTGRLAGSGFQAQNLPSHCEKEPDPLIESFVDDDYDFIRLWGGIIPTASGLLRSVIKSRKGMKFISGDLKGVEARGTMWVAEEWDLLEKVAAGLDNYAVTAAEMYAKTVELVDHDERQAGKISVLSGGFGGGWRALLNMARKMDMFMTEELAKTYNRQFREARPKLVKKWEQFGKAARKAVIEPGVVIPVDDTGRYFFFRTGNWLFMKLPSGRLLSFPFPRLKTEPFFGREVTNVAAMWVNNKNQWCERTITGPNFFQSAVQATCADLLMESHQRIERAKFPLFLSVHDEGASEVPDDARYSVEEYDRMMCVVPLWAEGFPIEADCWEGYRYKK